MAGNPLPVKVRVPPATLLGTVLVARADEWNAEVALGVLVALGGLGSRRARCGTASIGSIDSNVQQCTMCWTAISIVVNALFVIFFQKTDPLTQHPHAPQKPATLP